MSNTSLLKIKKREVGLLPSLTETGPLQQTLPSQSLTLPTANLRPVNEELKSGCKREKKKKKKKKDNPSIYSDILPNSLPTQPIFLVCAFPQSNEWTCEVERGCDVAVRFDQGRKNCFDFLYLLYIIIIVFKNLWLTVNKQKGVRWVCESLKPQTANRVCIIYSNLGVWKMMNLSVRLCVFRFPFCPFIRYI